MHSLNAVFLLGDIALNSLVSFSFCFCDLIGEILQHSMSIIDTLSCNFTRVSPGSGLHTSYFGPQSMSYSSGWSMHVWISGKNLFDFFVVYTTENAFWEKKKRFHHLNLLLKFNRMFFFFFLLQVAIPISWPVLHLCPCMVSCFIQIKFDSLCLTPWLEEFCWSNWIYFSL